MIPKKNKKPWPTKAVMQQIYELQLWGSNGLEFYSGEGSHEPSIVNPYIKMVTSFLQSFKKTLSVCDLGCGDFNIGKQLAPFSTQYYAIDIVPELIEYNSRQFKVENVDFLCLDISKATLPKADCVIIRQVLQHLSNQEILRIAKKLKAYTYIIITEHIPEGDFIANKDCISGQGIRIKKQSGINLLKPPFNLEVKKQTVLLSHHLHNNKGVITTLLYEL